MGDELVGPPADRFQIEWRNAVEQPLARAQRDRRDMQPQLIEQSRGKVLIDGRRTSGDRDIPITTDVARFGVETVIMRREVGWIWVYRAHRRAEHPMTFPVLAVE